MRKDYEEAYYEELTKPFNSRWPGGTTNWPTRKTRTLTTSSIPPIGTRMPGRRREKPGRRGRAGPARAGMHTKRSCSIWDLNTPALTASSVMAVTLDGETV